MGEGGLVLVSLRDLVQRGSARGRCPAHSSTTSLTLAPLCAGTHRMVTSLSLARMHEQASMAATANRWSGPSASLLTLSMAAVESTNTVPVAVLLALGQGAKGLAYYKGLRVEDLFVGSDVAAASRPPLLGPDACRSTLPSPCRELLVQTVSRRLHSLREFRSGTGKG